MYTLSHVLDENSELLQVISNNDLKHDMERIEKEYLDGKEQIVGVEIIYFLFKINCNYVSFNYNMV